MRLRAVDVLAATLHRESADDRTGRVEQVDADVVGVVQVEVIDDRVGIVDRYSILSVADGHVLEVASSTTARGVELEAVMPDECLLDTDRDRGGCRAMSGQLAVDVDPDTRSHLDVGAGQDAQFITGRHGVIPIHHDRSRPDGECPCASRLYLRIEHRIARLCHLRSRGESEHAAHQHQHHQG